MKMDGWSSVVMVFLLDFCRIGDQTGCIGGGGGGLARTLVYMHGLELRDE